MKQKRKRLNISSYELQLIKNYYNFRHTDLTNTKFTITKFNKTVFISYGTINVISGYQRDIFNNFKLLEKDNVELIFERLSASSIKSIIKFSSLKSVESIINSGIYMLVVKIKNKSNKSSWNNYENYFYYFKILNQLKSLNPTDENSFSFNPSLVIEIGETNSLVPRRTEQLKKYLTQKINIQIRSCLIYSVQKLEINKTNGWIA